MSRPISLHSEFNAAQPELQNYVVALEAENKKLHTQIAHLQVQDLTKQHRIDALEKEMKSWQRKQVVASIWFLTEKRRHEQRE